MRLVVLLEMVTVLVAVIAYDGYAQRELEVEIQNELFSLSGSAGANFGRGVALNDKYFVVGAPDESSSRGAIYVYQNQNEQVGTMSTTKGPQSGSYFGDSLALDGDRLVVGAKDANRAFLYTLSSGGADESSEVSLDGLVTSANLGGSNFGNAVAISWPYIAVGAPKSSNGGTVAVFEYDGSKFVVSTLPRPSSTELFGNAVFMTPGGTGRLLVGDPLTEKAYLYVRASIGSWTLKQTFGNGLSGSKFGFSLTASPDWKYVGVGAQLEDVQGTTQQGAVYVFQEQSNGGDYSQVKHITDPEGNVNDKFGLSIGMNHEQLIVSTSEIGDRMGGAFLYYLDNLDAYDKKLFPEKRLTKSNYGHACAINRKGTSMVGSQGNGKVYFFRNTVVEGGTAPPTSKTPTKQPTKDPTTRQPTTAPTRIPTKTPTKQPTNRPTQEPTTAPIKSFQPTKAPVTRKPTASPTRDPTHDGTPTAAPTRQPSVSPTYDDQGKTDLGTAGFYIFLIFVLSLLVICLILGILEFKTGKSFTFFIPVIVSCYDFITDGLFAAELAGRKQHSLFAACLAFIAIPMALNFVASIYLVGLLHRERDFEKWADKNDMFLGFIRFLSLFTMDSFRIMCSKVSKRMTSFNAPIEKEKRRIVSLGLINTIFEDIPQVIIILMANRWSSWTLPAIASFIVSCTSLLFNFVLKTNYLQLYYITKDRDSDVAENNDNRMGTAPQESPTSSHQFEMIIKDDDTDKESSKSNVATKSENATEPIHSTSLAHV